MSHPPRLALVLALTLTPLARADEQTRPRGAPGPGATPDFYAAYAETAAEVRVLPLVKGRLPDLTAGVVLRPDWSPGVARARAPGLVILPDADLLMILGGEWLRWRRDPATGAWAEVLRGAWPAGHGLIGAADLDGDGQADLVLQAPREPRTLPWRVKVAPGLAGGGFDLGRAPLVVARATWTGFFGLGDADDDGRPDLIYHLQDYGGFVAVDVHYRPGLGDLTFGEPRGLASGREAAGSVAVARLAAEGRHTIVLGADDDADDVGQAQEVVRGDDGAWQVRAGVDLEPHREESSHDEGMWELTPTDVDLDGYADLIARWDAWYAPTTRQTVVKVLRGRPGGWAAAETMVDRHFPKDAGPSLAFPPAP